MEVIYKYKLDIVDEQVVKMSIRGKILSAQNQKGELCIWVKEKPNDPSSNRVIKIIGTGNPIEELDEELEFIDTVQIGQFVWHVFEKVG